MANGVVPVLLNKGLDTVTPPLLAESGALIDALNYEMTTTAGYKRIDGYERFDGYPDAAAANMFYSATITAVVPANQAAITVGSVISRIPPATSAVLADPVYDDVGVIVAITGGNVYRYVPFDENGVLNAGDTVMIRSPSLAPFHATSSSSTSGKSLGLDSSAYLQALRDYQTILRSLVVSAPGNIAGMWYLKNNLYIAVDAQIMTFISDDLGIYPTPGSLVRWNGTIYRVLDLVPRNAGTVLIPGLVKMAVHPVGTSSVVNTSVVEVTDSDSTIFTYAASYNNAIEDTTNGSEWAYVVRANRPQDSTSRGFTALRPAIRIPYDAGSYSSESLPLGSGWTLRNADGTKTVQAELVEVTKSTGTFAGGSAAGYATVKITGNWTGGSRIEDNWELWYDGSRRLTVNIPFGGLEGLKIAGTLRLRQFNTRYQYIAANFYGNAASRSAYVTTGASRAFWADEDSCGMIFTSDNSSIDIPKYVAFHAERLSLGFEVGSVIQSVAGEPTNFSGVAGAREIATGDRITGLAEMPGDVLAVFGLNAIRRIDAAAGSVSTISAAGGAFDYTVAMFGQEPIFTNAAGISLLSQTASYGDFQGQRASEKIHTWLRPRLLVDNQGFETGGVACAYVVRNKNQYRLHLKNGDVVCLTYTPEGYKLTPLNYGNGNDLRVPFAWSSAIGDDRKEYIHVAWDRQLAARGIRGVVGTLPDQKLVYQLDAGWGFDGVTFRHYFDLAHLFVNNGQEFTGVEGIRIHGQSYGIATLVARASGIEDDYDQPYTERSQDISMPRTPVMLRDNLANFTNYVDHANWGLGIKLRIEGGNAAGSTALTEPSHICQVLVLQIRSEGASDNG